MSVAVSRYAEPTTGTTLALEECPAVQQGTSNGSLADALIFTAVCSDPTLELDWIPETELITPPDDVLAACRACPARQACLEWALTNCEAGYWGGSSSRQREQMRRLGLTSVDELESITAMRHAPGAGSAWHYRRGCSCAECREAHRLQRVGERARRRSLSRKDSQ